MRLFAFLTVAVSLGFTAFAAQPSLPENLALKARITANSEHSQAYRAQFVADGKIPAANSREDLNQAWAVNGGSHRHGAELTLAWDQPVTIAEIVFFGRTAWFVNECWKDYQVYSDDSLQPLHKGQLREAHGPQRITLPAAVRAQKLSLKFTSSYGGLNPGASEIQVYPSPLSEKQFARVNAASTPAMPWMKQAEIAGVRDLIAELVHSHGANYKAAAAHKARLAELENQSRDGNDIADDLAQLQRDILLFDVDRLLVIKRHEINASHVYTYHNEDFRAGGGLYVYSARDPKATPLELVSSPSGQILDCDLSYDGQVVLFSWRQRENEGYHLWRINIDGTGLQQLTRGEWHDYNGCWLPDGGIAFVSTRSAQFAYCWNSPVGIVHRMDADASNVRQLSANYLNDFTPYPLEDGRIIYSRWEYVDKPAIPIQSLWTINPDGTGLLGYYGNRVISPGTFMEARPIPGTTKIICTMTGHNGPARGAIGVIDRTRGVNAQEAIWNVTPDVPVPAVDQGNGNFEGAKLYNGPCPLDSTRFLVSARGPILARNLSGACQSLVLDATSTGLQFFSAQPVRPRPRPRVHSSTLAEYIRWHNRLRLSSGRLQRPRARGQTRRNQAHPRRSRDAEKC